MYTVKVFVEKNINPHVVTFDDLESAKAYAWSIIDEGGIVFDKEAKGKTVVYPAHKIEKFVIVEGEAKQ